MFVGASGKARPAACSSRTFSNDSAAAPRFIETIPRRGYRFIAAMDEGLEPAAEPVPPLASSRNRGFDGLPLFPTGGISRSRLKWLAGAAVVTLLFGAIFTRLVPVAGRTSTELDRPPTGQLVRLTSTAGVNVDPAFSPDGSLIAYASDRHDGAGLDIWVQPLAGGAAGRLTSDEGDEAEPSFSPDGASIVYAKRETGGIYVVSARGSEPQPLVQVPRARMPRFSPDGRWVLYWTGRPVWGALETATPNAIGTLAIVPARGGTPRTLAAGLASARFGVWSPDSTRVLFLGARRGDDGGARRDWYLTAIDGAEPVPTGALAVLESAGISGTPVPGDWDRTDSSVVFASTGNGGSNVWKVTIATATGTLIGAPRRLTFGTAIERGPVVGGPGRIAFTSLVENVDVWRVPLDPSSGVAAGPIERVTDGVGRDRVMNVSEDGRTMAFVSSRLDGDSVWIRELDSGRERQIAQTAAARISPDGVTVAITHEVPRRQTVLVTLNDGTSSRFCDNCGIADWSRDGSQVLVGQGTPARLLIRDARTGRETPLASHPSWSLLQGRFSPDGRWVAFHTAISPTLRQIFLVPANTGESVPSDRWVPVVTDFGIQPSWSADGLGIYYFSYRDGAFCAWLQPLDPATMQPAGRPRAVQHLHQPRLRAVAGAVVTNDVRGGYLYATLTETTGNIWMISPSQSSHTPTR
jgi:eukaryotic-like serine/threonine-protein kinase